MSFRAKVVLLCSVSNNSYNTVTNTDFSVTSPSVVMLCICTLASSRLTILRLLNSVLQISDILISCYDLIVFIFNGQITLNGHIIAQTSFRAKNDDFSSILHTACRKLFYWWKVYALKGVPFGGLIPPGIKKPEWLNSKPTKNFGFCKLFHPCRRRLV